MSVLNLMIILLIVIEIFYLKPQISMPWWDKILSLGILNVCTKFCVNLSDT